MQSLQRIGLLVFVLFSVGCNINEDTDYDFVGTELSRTKIDDLARTLKMASNERQFNLRELQANIRSGLNRWQSFYEDLVQQVPWQMDPLFEPLLKEDEDTAVLKEIDTFNFIDTDALYLQELFWLSEITKRVTDASINSLEVYRLAAGDFKPETDDLLPTQQLIAKLNPSLDQEGAKKLTHATLWFDWIVRNVNLLPEVDHGGDNVDELRLNDRKTLEAAGVAGTGYQHLPYQNLIFGRGDYQERAKLFMEGLHLLGIDAVVFAAAPENPDTPLNPWAVGVAIGNEFYLFDTRLGLAIPGKEIGSFATLNELRANPELLSSLDLSIEESLEENTKYWITPEQVKSLKGLLYVTPEAASRRFYVLERQLPDDQRLPYSMVASDLVKRLPEHDGIEYQVWDIGVKTHQFRQAVREALEDTTNADLQRRLSWYFQEEAYVVDFPRLRTARVRFFLGQFQNQRELLKYNAIESLQLMLYSDEDIEGLAANQYMQQQVGILRADTDSADFKQRLASVQAQMRLVRDDTGPFIVQCHFDNNSFGAVENWIKIIRSQAPGDRWKETLDYLSGRSKESLKDYDAAMAEYRKYPKLLQAHGNILRARLLEQAIEKVYGEVSK